MAAALTSLVPAILLLNILLTLANVWPTPAVTWRGEISVELAVAIVALAAVTRNGRRPSRALIGGLSSIWMALALGRYAAITAPALYGRDVNLYWDLRFVPDVAAMIARVARAWQLVLALLIVGLTCAGAYVILRAAWRRVGVAMLRRGERRALEALAVATIVLFAGQQTSEHFVPYPRVAAPVTAAYARQARVAVTALTASTYVPPSPPMSADLDAIRGADVFVMFVEAYGAVTYTRPDLAAPLAAARARLEAAIRETHREVVSAFVESPTFGGSSWLAHISLLSGVEVRDPDRNARLMTERRDTLPRAFARRGFRTVALMPGLRTGWPEGAFYGFDEIYGANRLGYRGPEFGWFAIPDQYSLERLDELEVNNPVRPPLFVFFPTISTHFPFSPTPPYQPDWGRLTDPHPYDGADIVRAYGREVDWVHFGPAYANAIAYDLATIAGYLRQHASRDAVFVVLGDHQPAAAVSGEGASWDVPVHVIANRADVVDRLRPHGFVSGVTPVRTLGKMHTLTPRLLAAFSRQ